MTEGKSFKRLVRVRMEKTGERFTAARAALLAAEGPDTPDRPVLSVSDEAIRRRTGRGWEEWFDLLDESDAVDRPHREIARWLVDEHGIDGWSAQSVTVSFERARGLRKVGQRAGGFAATASKTIGVPVERLYDAFVAPSLRRRWLPEDALHERRATRPRSARFDWGEDGSRVNVGFTAKGEDRSALALEHERLPDAEQAERMKAFWRERMTALKDVLEA